MEEYLRRCGRVTVRSRAMEEVKQQLSSSKKRKLYSELENQYFGDVNFLENSASQEASGISVCTKHDVPYDVVKERNIDLQSEGFETEISSRETTPISELCGDSEEVLMDSSLASIKKLSTAVTVHRRNIPAAGKMPGVAELEEFFSAAEKYEQKRFAEKYNYDVALDVPLEGRYKWEVCNLQP